jgi:hypothetical protein
VNEVNITEMKRFNNYTKGKITHLVLIRMALNRQGPPRLVVHACNVKVHASNVKVHASNVKVHARKRPGKSVITKLEVPNKSLDPSPPWAQSLKPA